MLLLSPLVAKVLQAAVSRRRESLADATGVALTRYPPGLVSALEKLRDDNAQLTAVLTHHVIEGRLAPEQLAGEHSTVNGDTVTIEGSGEAFTIPADQTLTGEAAASVVCGR